ncbi:MAG: prepilin-type N-terminal cleavage/methylation domain-containing protein [Thermodesulfovibrio sp.]|uniref:prepilin-type N-terminal cleavage/methylation domain-containing protein n=1 Tax=Thermodesulfovibrio sp. N1 TaxID=1871110 RepID=UPI00083AA6D0|nr:prepilin-type N-terminal cleavage/methylation domain-containing protein [Thermodesulfovibrio sp. N1]MDI6713525.1 prepilin-type N-terminal cleavage/methylation domain-containing protein [Thermodesulfovibrio sp.]ODA43384.1 hypothetical protein THER_1892 [Thermodesulfovibrio sp. N1]
MQNKSKNQGLTLVEVAIVLVILGLLIGLGASLIGPLTKRAKIQESRDIVKQAKEAVLGYAVKNGYLPATLDNAGARKLDAWGRELIYYPDNEIRSSDVCSKSTTATQVYECTNTDCTSYNTKSNIAFIIYSKGEDTDGECTGATSPFYIRQQGMPYNSPCTYTTTNPKYYYDDVVVYVSLDEIRALRGCPKFRITTEFLHYGYKGSQYGAQLSVTDGFPNYTWNITGLNQIGGLSLKTSDSCSYDSVNLTCDNASPCICGTPTNYGTFSIKIEVTDSKNQTATKNLSLTINPSSDEGRGCTTYSLIISNQGNEKSYRIDSGICRNIGNNESLSLTGLISNNILTIYQSSACSGQTLLSGSMQNLDSNGNCVVNVSCQGNNCGAN